MLFARFLSYSSSSFQLCNLCRSYHDAAALIPSLFFQANAPAKSGSSSVDCRKSSQNRVEWNHPKERTAPAKEIGGCGKARAALKNRDFRGSKCKKSSSFSFAGRGGRYVRTRKTVLHVMGRPYCPVDAHCHGEAPENLRILAVRRGDGEFHA